MFSTSARCLAATQFVTSRWIALLLALLASFVASLDRR